MFIIEKQTKLYLSADEHGSCPYFAEKGKNFEIKEAEEIAANHDCLVVRANETETFVQKAFVKYWDGEYWTNLANEARVYDQADQMLPFGGSKVLATERLEFWTVSRAKQVLDGASWHRTKDGWRGFIPRPEMWAYSTVSIADRGCAVYISVQSFAGETPLNADVYSPNFWLSKKAWEDFSMSSQKIKDAQICRQCDH